MEFTVTLMATCFSPTHYAVTMNIVDWQHRFMSVTAYKGQVDLLRQVLPNWHELVDVVVDKAMTELERLGVPEAEPGDPQEGRFSGELTFRDQLSYRELQSLYDQVGGMMDTTFMPPHNAPAKSSGPGQKTLAVALERWRLSWRR